MISVTVTGNSRHDPRDGGKLSPDHAANDASRQGTRHGDHQSWRTPL
ncbi:hypothetical protein AB395_0000423 [Sinorhizobium fredii CCBAU 45436]|nr:hypothetical protein AB395_0000423 [Sinorhizobium fredii CCBAU 45436]